MSQILLVLSVGLAILWLFGVSANPWVAWLDLAMAFSSLRLAQRVSRPDYDPGSLLITSLSLSTLFFVFWLGALWNNVAPWLTGSNLAATLVYLTIGIYAGGKIPTARSDKAKRDKAA